MVAWQALRRFRWRRRLLAERPQATLASVVLRRAGVGRANRPSGEFLVGGGLRSEYCTS